MTPLLVVLALSGCSGSPGEDESAAVETGASPRASASSPTPTTSASASASETATATRPPESPAAPTATAAPASLAWTDASLWATCQQAWERQQTGITWTGWQAFRSSDASTTSDGLHYVARFKKDGDGGVVADRDCVIGGTRSVPSVFLDPPLDGFDRSKMPAPSATFAVR